MEEGPTFAKGAFGQFEPGEAVVCRQGEATSTGAWGCSNQASSLGGVAFFHLLTNSRPL